MEVASKKQNQTLNKVLDICSVQSPARAYSGDLILSTRLPLVLPAIIPKAVTCLGARR